MKVIKLLKDDQGIVLVAGLMFLALLAILGSTAYMLSSTDVTISANYKYSEEAFNDAEAGANFGKAAIEAALKAGSYLPSAVGDTMTMFSSAPGDFAFTFSTLEKTGDNAFTFTSTGHGSQGATAEIEVTVSRRSAFEYAVFGRDVIDLKNSTGVFSYNSLDGLPDPGDGTWNTSNPAHDLLYSTHNGDVGSNGDADGSNDIILNNGSIVDGDVVQGAAGDPLVEAVIKDSGGLVTGENDSIGPVDTDPLNIAGDDEFNDKFPSYDPGLGGSNDNNLAQDTLDGTTVGVGAVLNSDGFTLVGKSGGANYYFDEINLGNGDTLIINASAGPVNIWVKGRVVGDAGSEFDIQNTASDRKVILNVTEPTGGCGCATIIDFKNSGDFAPYSDPGDVMIKTDSDETVSIHNGNVTKAVIYAPFAAVDFDNGAAFYGSVRGASVALKNSMKVYYDEALKDAFLGNDVDYTSWQQVLN